MLLLSYSFVFAQKTPQIVLSVDDREVRFPEFMAYAQEQEIVDVQELAYRWSENLLKAKAAREMGLDTLFFVQNIKSSYLRRQQQKYLLDSLLDNRAVRYYSDKKQGISSNEYFVVSQIYKRLPQNISTISWKKIENQMDSIWSQIQRGTSFEDFLQSFSDEKETLVLTSKDMFEEMEVVVKALASGEVSKPFFTPIGIHIVKLLKRQSSMVDENVYTPIDESVDVLSKDATLILDDLKVQYDFNVEEEALNELLLKGSTEKTLFILGGKAYVGSDFSRFSESYPAGIKRQWEAFVEKSILDYAIERLPESFLSYTWKIKWVEEERLAQLVEDSLMKQVPDAIMLRNYFEQNRSKYAWESPRYYGVVLSGSSKRILKQAQKFLKTLPMEEWEDALRLVFNKDSIQIKFEKGLYVEGDHPYVDEKIFKQGKSQPMSGYPFRRLLGKKIKEPENYDWVKEQLVQDCMQAEKKAWLDGLKRKSKVEINQEVLKTVNNN